MPSFKTWFAAACVGLLACGGSEPKAPETPAFGAAFSNLPLPPAPQLVSRSGSNDALQLTLRTPSDVPHMVDYYRDALSKGKWKLVSDTKNRDGSIILYAEQNGPPLWVRIWKPADSNGSMVQLTGAVVGKSTPGEEVKRKR
jgi:hypothetical protein